MFYSHCTLGTFATQNRAGPFRIHKNLIMFPLFPGFIICFIHFLQGPCLLDFTHCSNTPIASRLLSRPSACICISSHQGFEFDCLTTRQFEVGSQDTGRVISPIPGELLAAPKMPRGPILPRLDSLVAAAPPLVTLHTATAPSPATCHSWMKTSILSPIEAAQDDGTPRSGSDYLGRVRDMLTPTQPSSSLPSSNAVSEAEEKEELNDSAAAAGSRIVFFARHPLDTGLPNPLTFLGGSSAVGQKPAAAKERHDGSSANEKPLVEQDGRTVHDMGDGNASAHGESLDSYTTCVSTPSCDIPLFPVAARGVTNVIWAHRERNLPVSQRKAGQ